MSSQVPQGAFDIGDSADEQKYLRLEGKEWWIEGKWLGPPGHRRTHGACKSSHAIGERKKSARHCVQALVPGPATLSQANAG